LADDGEDGIVGEEEVLGALSAEAVVIGIATEDATGGEGGDIDAMAVAAEENGVAGIVGDATGDGAFDADAGLALDLFGGVAGDVEDVNFLEGIIHAPREVFAEAFAGGEVKSVAAFVVDGRDEAGLAVEEFGTDGDLAIKEVRFGEGEDEIFSLGAVLDAHAEFLATAGEVGPAGDVEISLGDFGEAEEAIDGAESGTEVKGSGAFFFDEDIEIFAAGDEGIGGVSIDLGEVVEVHEALLACVDANGIKDFAWSEGEFSADDLVFRSGVSGDVDVFEVALDAFFDIESDIDDMIGGWGGIGASLEVDIATSAVEVLEGFDGGADFLRGIDFALFQLGAGDNFVGGEDFSAEIGDLSNVIDLAFGDCEADIDFAAIAGDLGGLDFDIHVAAALVEVADGDDIGLEDFGIELTGAAGENIQESFFGGFDRLLDVFGGDRLVADNRHGTDGGFVAFFDGEGDSGSAEFFVGVGF